jgi:predicted ester cyclase
MGIARDTVDRWWAMFEQGRLDELPGLVTTGAEIVMPGGMRFRGPAELRPLLEAYRAGFPDVRHEIVGTVENDRGIAIELRITMTHTGTFATPMGEVPPSGNLVVLDACDVVSVDGAGMVTSWHTYFDQASLMAQLGVGAPA